MVLDAADPSRSSAAAVSPHGKKTNNGILTRLGRHQLPHEAQEGHKTWWSGGFVSTGGSVVI
jgi:hypothetical protein